MIEMLGRQGSGVARIETKAAGPSTIVDSVSGSLIGTRLGYSFNNLLQGMIESQGEVERFVENALREIDAVVTNMIQIDSQAPLVLLKHQNNVRSVAACMGVA